MRTPRLVGLGLIGAFALTGCGSAIAPVAMPTPTTDRNVQVSTTFSTDGGTGITYDPALVPVGSRGAVSAGTGDAGTTVTLAVRGLEPDRDYGAHAHTEPCGPTGDLAGPHHQHEVDPVQPSVDPVYANAENEIWLDLTTDASGAATSTASVPWTFGPDRRAQSVIIHAMPTATGPGEAGTAGARVACISVEF
ncbi:superoxide dismutase family protein [Pseudonocardia abyssalis]|uniref:Superoxide dismutase family protein n=1 Tax=Pseudonocardia abyssalis TaxID=2792008 RepID=A0ABS6UX67_9PSEU|nr:superoxide dismutase family protein [Pseudonocardia abyssalis]MBW0118859.1 superoxide dismutase family protein [Pseudonocardia abyssalis]MBW0136863.1 superoxide dismutase family protein [Pseudonocardia abyssalis]